MFLQKNYLTQYRSFGTGPYTIGHVASLGSPGSNPSSKRTKLKRQIIQSSSKNIFSVKKIRVKNRLKKIRLEIISC